MAKKVKATRTINPLHFEDLEPHRFEDLVRRLLYSFRDWSNIEATGRGGSDEGFDIRAWEANDAVTNVNDAGEEGIRRGEGHLWQVQGKREKTIAPGKMRTLIDQGVDGAQPPYGYILAAATNISKTAYDAFREKLREKGVTEFYFWGKDHLEDQLFLPENDEILFTFFGLSLSPQRRSRTAELKFSINNKNKILKSIFGTEPLAGQTMNPKGFLLVDIKAEHYPFKAKYPDFEKYRRWEEHYAADVTANGVFFKFREHYAYINTGERQWDFSAAVDLTLRKNNIDRANQARLEDEGKKAEFFWKHLPHRMQAKLLRYGFVRFEDMLIIDDKGDPEYTDPHIYIDFSPKGPFHFIFTDFIQNGAMLHEDEPRGFERVKVFPEKFPDLVKAKIHDLEGLALGPENAGRIEWLTGSMTIYSVGEKIKTMTVGNIIRVPKRNENHPEKYAEVTFAEETTVAELLKRESVRSREQLESYAGRKLSDAERIFAYELHEVALSSTGEHLYYVSSRWNG